MLQRWIRHHNSCFHNFSRRNLSVLFFGSDVFSKACLKSLHKDLEKTENFTVTDLGVVCLPESNNKLPTRVFAEKHNIPCSTWPNYPERECFYDIGVVVSFGKLIPKSVISSFKYGMINVHASLLPRWRGASPLAHAIMADDEVTGITVMQIAPGKFDHGKILEWSKPVIIKRDWTAEDLGIALEDVASECLLKCLKDIEYYLQNSKEQNKDGITYAPKITLEDTKISWSSQTAEEIYKRFLAFGFRKDLILRSDYRDNLVKFQKLRLPDDRQWSHLPFNADPGEVFYDKPTKSLFVKCKVGYIEIMKLIYNKPLSPVDFFNGSMQVFIKKGEKIKFVE